MAKIPRHFIRNFSALFVLTVLVSGTAAFLLPKVMDSFAVSPPPIVSYQGRLLNSNGAPVSDASLSMEFRFYDSAAGGVCLWSNSSLDCDTDTPGLTTPRTVTLTDGLFSENLGDTTLGVPYAFIPATVFGDNASVYLEIEIAGEVLSPRKRIVAAGFALNAGTLDGVDSTELLSSAGDTATGDYDFTGAEFQGASPFVFEGATAGDGFETTFFITDPGADRTITFKDEDGTVAYLSDVGGAGNIDDAYDNYGAVASIINVDAAEGQTGGLEFSIDGTDNLVVDLQSTGDFNIQDAGTGFLAFRDNKDVIYQGAETGQFALLSDLSAGNRTFDLFQISVSNDVTNSMSSQLFELQQGDVDSAGDVAVIVGDGTGTALFIDQNGDTGGSINDTTGGALHITNTGNASHAFTVYSNHAGAANAALLELHADNAAFDRQVLRVENDGTSPAIEIVQNGDTSTSGALHIDNSLNDGGGLRVTTSNNATVTNPLARFIASDSAFDQSVLYLESQGVGDTLRIEQNGNTASAISVFSDSTTNNSVEISAIGTTTGSILSLNGSNNWTDDSGLALEIDVVETTETADIVAIQTDFGGADNDVYRIEADGEVFSDVGFTAGSFSTNFYDGSIVDSDSNADDFFDFSLAAGADSFRVLTGNLRVGNGAPDNALNGEDFYVEGGAEFDSGVQFDGNLTMNGTTTFNDDADFVFVTDGAQSENITITATHATDVSMSPLVISMTNTAATDVGFNAFINLDNNNDGGATGTPDAFMRFSQNDTNETIDDGVLIVSAGGAITDAFSASDSEIVNALNAGANNVLYQTIRSGEFSGGVLTWEDTAGNDLMTLTDTGTTGTLNVTGDITCTDCLDFTDFGDDMTLDTATEIDLGANLFSINLDSTGDFAFEDAGSAYFTVVDNQTFDYIHTGPATSDMIDVLSSTITDGSFLDLDFTAPEDSDIIHLTASGAAFTGNTFVSIVSDGAATGRNLGLRNDGLGEAIFITHNGDTGTVSGTGAGGAIHLDNSSNDGLGLTIYSDQTGTNADAPLVEFHADDLTFDQTVLFVQQDGVGSGVRIDQNGDTGSTINDTTGGSLHVGNTGNDDYGFTMYTNATTENTALSRFHVDSATFSQNVLDLINDGSGAGLYIDQNNDTGALTTFDDDSGGAFHISNTGNNDAGLTVYTDNNGTQDEPLVRLFADNSAFDEPVLQVGSDGTNPALYVSSLGDTGTTISSTAGGAFHINAGSTVPGYAATIYSATTAAADAPVFGIFQDHVGFDQNVFEIRSDGNGGGSGLFIDYHFTDNNGGGAAAIDIDANSSGAIVEIFNDGNSDSRSGIDIQGCLDTSPTATCNYITFMDGNGTTLGAVEGDGAGGVTNASAGSDYAELFPGTYANFSAGDVLAVDTSGNIKLASAAGEMIGAFSIAPNTLGNWVEDWQLTGVHVPVALLGQVPVNVNDSNGSIAVGDRLTLSATAGVAMKQTGPGHTIGIALEAHGSGSGQIEIYISPSWYAGGVIAHDGVNNTFTQDFLFEESSTADVATQGKASRALTFRGSGWNGASADDVDMTLFTDVNSSSDYQLSIQNDTGTEVAFVNDDGDLAIAGRLYPSDQGALQTDKYIFYDSTNSPTMDYMRTNAAGWGVGSYDFAEMFPAIDEPVAGELVVFADDAESVQKSTGNEYDRRIAGIVSTRPGFLAGEFIEGHVPIALAGRVPTFVTTENGAVNPGDPLTTSSVPGYAMKATEPGPIVGYAMESLQTGVGSIIVYVNVSYYDGGPVGDAPASNNSASGIMNVSSLSLSGDLSLAGGTISSVAAITGVGEVWRIEANGDIITKGRITSVIESYAGEDVETHAVTSTETTVQLSGTAQLSNGSTVVEFDQIDPKFNDIISTGSYRVFLTANGASGSLYATNREQTGFVIRESNGSSDVLVDWLVIAYHKDHIPEPAVEEEEKIPTEEPIEAEVPAEDPIEEEESPVEDPAVEEQIDEPEPPIDEPIDSSEEDSPTEEELVSEDSEDPPVEEDPVVEELIEELPTDEPVVEE